MECPACHKKVLRAWCKAIVEVEYGVFDVTVQCGRCGSKTIVRQPLVRSKTVDGYVTIRVPTSESVYRTKGWVAEHKYVWEKAHGPLPPGWLIHHVNRIKTDNRLENLIAMPKTSHDCNPPGTPGMSLYQRRDANGAYYHP